jgi:hypothetical protein
VPLSCLSSISDLPIADVNIIAASGLRLSYQEGDGWGLPIPMRFNWTLGVQSTPVWDFQRFVPQGVIINLGTNDYWHGVEPAYFRESYQNFLSDIRSVYGNQVTFFLLCGPAPQAEPGCALIKQLAQTEPKAHYLHLGQDFSPEDFGVSACTSFEPETYSVTVWHPSECFRSLENYECLDSNHFVSAWLVGSLSYRARLASECSNLLDTRFSEPIELVPRLIGTLLRTSTKTLRVQRRGGAF